MGVNKEMANSDQNVLHTTLQWFLGFSDLHISIIEEDLYHIQRRGLHCTVKKYSAI
jgi:hypothetical protein